jgi:hypothetical protein
MRRRPPVQAFIQHTPASFDQLWRSGALPGLVATLAKGVERSASSLDPGGADPAALAALWDLLRPLHPLPGQEPWFAASAERQQFALFVLARVGTSAAAMSVQIAAPIIAVRLDGDEPAIDLTRPDAQVVDAAAAALAAAATQVAQQPLLRGLLEVVAPTLLPEADAVLAHGSDGSASVTPPSEDPLGLDLRPRLPSVPLHFLRSLARQLDPLALGLALPGCYNPACTSLAGASEAAMPLKRCAGCNIARWVGLGSPQVKPAGLHRAPEV